MKAAKKETTSRKSTRPITVNGKVTPPARQKNADRRSREHLTPEEVDKLMKEAGATGRHGHRDSTLLLIAYRHGLRVSEVTSLRWDQLGLKQGLMHVNRLKNGVASTH